MKMKKLLAVVLTLAMTVSMFAGCGTKKSTKEDTSDTKVTGEATVTEGASTAATDDRSAYPGTTGDKEITINLSTEPPELCSLTSTDTVSFSVLRHVIENLVELDENDQVIPGVATDWKASDDGLNYTFNLRKDMKWSNGEPVTAKDFVFAWTKLLDAKTASPYSYFGYIFKNGAEFNAGKAKAADLGFKATDDYTLEITLAYPAPYFVSMLAFAVLAPVNEKAYNEFGTKYGTDADKLVTNGPFKMTSWEHESQIVLEKDPNFYDADKIELNKITMTMINDSNASLNSFKAGELDMTGVTGEQVTMLKGEAFPTYSYDDGSVFYLEYNTTDKQLNNANLRKAITYAIDKNAFVKSIVQNASKAAVSFTAPNIQANGENFKDSLGADLVPALDIAKAKEYLEKAKKELGTDEIKLTMICDDSDVAIKNAAFVQEQLKTSLGIKLEVESMPFKSRIERMTNKDFSMVFAGWGPDYNDPMTFLDMFETGNGNNHTSYSNADYDALLDKARAELDPAARLTELQDLEKLLMTDLPIGPIYWRSRDYVLSGKIKSGVVRTAFQDINLRNVKLN